MSDRGGQVSSTVSEMAWWEVGKMTKNTLFLLPGGKLQTAVSSVSRQLHSALTPTHHIGQYGNIPFVLSFLAQALRNEVAGDRRLAPWARAHDRTQTNLMYSFPEPSSEEWEPVRRFFANPWFERVWVVHEVVLASKATVFIGDWQMDWTALGRAVSWFHDHDYAFIPGLRGTSKRRKDVLKLSLANSVWQLHIAVEKRLPLLTLLETLRERKATLNVDKVFASFGLAQEISVSSRDGDRTSLAFHPLAETCYEKSEAAVYGDIARLLVITHGDLTVLSAIGASQTPPDQSSTAEHHRSWAPNWASKRAGTSLLRIDSERGEKFNASLDQSLVVGARAEPSVLSLQGFGVDRIRAYSRVLLPHRPGRRARYQEEHEFVLGAWRLARSQPLHRSRFDEDPTKGKLPWQSFAAALTAGVVEGKDADSREWLNLHVREEVALADLWLRIGTLDVGLSQGRVTAPQSVAFHDAFVKACLHRRFFITEGGLLVSAQRA